MKILRQFVLFVCATSVLFMNVGFLYSMESNLPQQPEMSEMEKTRGKRRKLLEAWSKPRAKAQRKEIASLKEKAALVMIGSFLDVHNKEKLTELYNEYIQVAPDDVHAYITFLINKPQGSLRKTRLHDAKSHEIFPLVALGADYNARTVIDQDPLMCMLARGAVEEASLLLTSITGMGEYELYRDYMGYSVLDYAIIAQAMEVIKILIQYHNINTQMADPDYSDQEGHLRSTSSLAVRFCPQAFTLSDWIGDEDVLHDAAKQNKDDVLTYLVKKGLPIDGFHQDDETSLAMMINRMFDHKGDYQKNKKTVQLLISLGADVNRPFFDEGNALSFLIKAGYCKNEDMNLITSLVEAGIDLNFVYSMGIWLSDGKPVRICSLLGEYLSLYKKDKDSSSWFGFSSNYELVSYLVSKGTKITPQDFAFVQQSNDPKLIAAFQGVQQFSDEEMRSCK